MIKLIANNEGKDGFDLNVVIKGNKIQALDELVAIFDEIYEQEPKLFETALLLSKYTEDHT